MESPASPDDVQLHDDGAAEEEGCIKIVRRSLKGLCNEAHKVEAKKIHQACSIIYWSQDYEAWKWKESSSIVM